MKEKNLNKIFSSLLIIASLFCAFFFVTDLGLIETSFLSYHVTRTIAIAVTEAFVVVSLISMTVISKELVKTKLYILAVFPAEILRIIVMTSAWSWFDRGTDNGVLMFRLVMGGVFAIWLVCIAIFIYIVLKNNEKKKA